MSSLLANIIKQTYIFLDSASYFTSNGILYKLVWRFSIEFFPILKSLLWNQETSSIAIPNVNLFFVNATCLWKSMFWQHYLHFTKFAFKNFRERVAFLSLSYLGVCSIVKINSIMADVKVAGLKKGTEVILCLRWVRIGEGA